VEAGSATFPFGSKQDELHPPSPLSYFRISVFHIPHKTLAKPCGRDFLLWFASQDALAQSLN
jgi:hypothetical protein